MSTTHVEKQQPSQTGITTCMRAASFKPTFPTKRNRVEAPRGVCVPGKAKAIRVPDDGIENPLKAKNHKNDGRYHADAGILRNIHG
jgi:hypothetical protein